MRKEYWYGINWVYKYYVGESKEWGWKYKYEYGPLVKDVMEYECESERESKAYDVKRQEAYVLPKELEGEMKWGFSKYIWEGHVVMKKEMEI